MYPKKHIKKSSFIICCILILNLLISAMPVYAAGETIDLNDPDKSEFQAFTLNNMFPGDAEYKDYKLNISHKNNIDVVFNVHIREESAKLAEVLKLKVEIDGVEKYNDLMKDLGQLTYTLRAGQPNVEYRLTVYLDTSVGKEYQNQELKADFEWYYTPESSGAVAEPEAARSDRVPARQSY